MSNNRQQELCTVLAAAHPGLTPQDVEYLAGVLAEHDCTALRAAQQLLQEIHDFARASYASVIMTDSRQFSDMQRIVNKIRRYWRTGGTT